MAASLWAWLLAPAGPATAVAAPRLQSAAPADTGIATPSTVSAPDAALGDTEAHATATATPPTSTGVDRPSAALAGLAGPIAHRLTGRAAIVAGPRAPPAAS